MKKLRILAICIAVGVLIWEVFLYYNLDAYMAIQNAYEDREAASVRVNDTGDPKVLCVHDIETEEVAVRLEFRDVTKDIEGLDHRYRLDVECRNKSKTQYRYRVELNGYSDSLITDGDDAEFISGNNYSISESSGRLDVEFVQLPGNLLNNRVHRVPPYEMGILRVKGKGCALALMLRFRDPEC